MPTKNKALPCGPVQLGRGIGSCAEELNGKFCPYCKPLIAAIPDLLESAKKIVNVVKELLPRGTVQPDTRELEEAIAKAEGE